MTTERRGRQNLDVREFILRNVTGNPATVNALAAKKFGLSRTAINRYTRRLIDESLLSATGKTSARRYQLVNFADEVFKIDVFDGLAEDQVWRFHILPLMEGVKQNIVDLCHYGFTEMLNNVVDHSASEKCFISYQQNYCEIRMMVIDYGIGVFEKIERDFNLADPRTALLELSKGKLTSDEKRHAGEGIFFTSRMFDIFYMSSGELNYVRSRQAGHDWLVEADEQANARLGTAISMIISTDAAWRPSDVFNEYRGAEIGFRKTHVPVLLGKYPNEELVSRSQAKRLLARFEDFSEVMLDFQGIAEIGQPFADEIFRVYRDMHPRTLVVATRANPEIEKMIEYVQKATSA